MVLLYRRRAQKGAPPLAFLETYIWLHTHEYMHIPRLYIYMNWYTALRRLFSFTEFPACQTPYKLDTKILLWVDRVFIHLQANKKHPFSFNIQAIKCLTPQATAPANQGLTNKFAYVLKVWIIVSIPSDIDSAKLDTSHKACLVIGSGFKQLNAWVNNLKEYCISTA